MQQKEPGSINAFACKVLPDDDVTSTKEVPSSTVERYDNFAADPEPGEKVW